MKCLLHAIYCSKCLHMFYLFNFKQHHQNLMLLSIFYRQGKQGTGIGQMGSHTGDIWVLVLQNTECNQYIKDIYKIGLFSFARLDLRQRGLDQSIMLLISSIGPCPVFHILFILPPLALFLFPVLLCLLGTQSNVPRGILRQVSL